jgi:hypothetical protein
MFNVANVAVVVGKRFRRGASESGLLAGTVMI